MMCNLPTPPQREPIGTQTKKLIKDAKDLFNLDLQEYEESMLNAEALNKLEFQYFGPGRMRINPQSKQPYNAFLKLVGKTFYYYVTKHPEQLKILND